MPVIIFMVGAAIASIVLGGLAMLLMYVVLPAIGIGLFIWLCVYLYQQNQESERRAEREQLQRSIAYEAERAQLAEVKKQEELLRIADQTQKDNTALVNEYAKTAGEIYRQMLPTGPGIFQVPLSQTPLANKIVAKMTDPFWSKELTDKNLASDVRDRLRYGAEEVGTKDKPIWPKDYKGKDAHKVYTPKEWWHLFDVLVSYQPFTNEQRYAHHWCLGKTGRGKTTFLRHLIKADLESVARDECSLVVIDSKKLVREMRSLKIFASGEPLDGYLTLVDSDVPFPLNPFYLPPAQARTVLSYMLASMTEASGLQKGALAFLIDAAFATSKPTLRTIRDYFALKKGELPKEFSRFDKDTQQWFLNIFPNLHVATREGLHQRLANFIKENPNLNRMFEADGFGIDIEELHKGGHVLLVDTDLNANGEDGTNLLGRLIIGLMEQLSTRRNKLDESSLKPVWLYIDEAADYIKTDSRFEQILTKARSSHIGATVAFQYRGQVDPKIEKALEIAEIQSVCVQKGTVAMTIADTEQPPLPVPRLEFNHEPQMTREEYKQLREWQSYAYPYKASPPPKDTNERPMTQKF